MADFRTIDVHRNADNLIRKCVAAKAGEKVLIVADTASEFVIVNALAAATSAVGAVPAIVVIPDLDYKGAAPMMRGAVEAADVVFTATSRSATTSSTAGRRRARCIWTVSLPMPPWKWTARSSWKGAE